MSAVLQLHVDQPPTRSQSGHGAVVTVRQVADGAGAYPDEPFEKAVVADGRFGTSVTVPAGRYRLEARLPNGRVLRQSRTLAEDANELVRFDIGGSSHEWLAWQTISGNVLPAELYEARRKDFSVRESDRGITRIFPDTDQVNANLGGPDGGVGVWLPSDFGTGAVTTGDADEEAYFELGTGVGRRVHLPVGTAIDLPVPYQLPPQFLSVGSTMEALTLHAPLEPALDADGDEMVSLWTARFHDMRDWNAPLAEGEPARRIAAMVATANATLLAFLPVPWTTNSGGRAEVELLHDLSAANDRGLRISVVDGDRAALLSYLGSSRMAEAAVAFGAGQLGEQVLLEMTAKRHNPLAAAAAAYVGLAFPVGDERREHWSPWLENLMNWFPGIPDGAILYARDRIERARSEEDLKEALKALRTGFDRGPPYFSAGVRHLLDGLSLFAADAERYGMGREELSAMHAQASNIALLTDPSQTFTVLKLRAGFLHV